MNLVVIVTQTDISLLRFDVITIKLVPVSPLNIECALNMEPIEYFVVEYCVFFHG